LLKVGAGTLVARQDGAVVVSMARVLVVEDDVHLARAVAVALGAVGYQVERMAHALLKPR
jgi:hypothetical protein